VRIRSAAVEFRAWLYPFNTFTNAPGQMVLKTLALTRRFRGNFVARGKNFEGFDNPRAADEMFALAPTKRLR